MQTVVALLLFASLAGASWWVYLRTGARRWTMERDPLGEPPVRMAALIGAIVIGVGIASSGGGGTEHAGSMQQGLGDGDDPGLLASSGSVETLGNATTGTSPVVAMTAAGDSGTASKTATVAGSARPTAAAPGRATRTEAEAKLPGYDRLVVRARKAAERRGAKITWYPTVVRKAESASRQRAR